MNDDPLAFLNEDSSGSSNRPGRTAPMPPLAASSRSKPSAHQVGRNVAILVAGGVAVALIIIIVIAYDRGAVPQPIKGLVSGGSTEQNAVREYMRKYSDSGQWEEIEWTGPVSADGRVVQASYPNCNEIIGLTFRAANTFGALQVSRQYFMIQRQGDSCEVLGIVPPHKDMLVKFKDDAFTNSLIGK
jgi:hypothetical protein